MNSKLSNVLVITIMVVIIGLSIWYTKTIYDDCRTNTKLSVLSCIELGD